MTAFLSDAGATPCVCGWVLTRELVDKGCVGHVCSDGKFKALAADAVSRARREAA